MWIAFLSHSMQPLVLVKVLPANSSMLVGSRECKAIIKIPVMIKLLWINYPPYAFIHPRQIPILRKHGSSNYSQSQIPPKSREKSEQGCPSQKVTLACPPSAFFPSPRTIPCLLAIWGSATPGQK